MLPWTMDMFCVVRFLLWTAVCAFALPSELRIGGLFETKDYNQLQTFNITAQIINLDNSFLREARLVALGENVPQYDSFQVSRTVCDFVLYGVIAIFGPQSVDTTDHVQSICDTMEIPHVEYRWDTRIRRGSCMVNLHPNPATLSKVYADIVKEWRWKSFAILYDDNDGLIRLNELLKIYSSKDFMVTVRQLDDGDDYRDTLMKTKQSGEKNIVLDCPASKLYNVLLQAQQVGLMGEEISYLITTMDIHMVDLEPFKYGGTNITGVRLIDPNNYYVGRFAQYWNYIGHIHPEYGIQNMTVDSISVDLALLHDAILLFAKSMNQLDNSTDIQIKQLSCDRNVNWEHGYSVINYMKSTEINGMTGAIKFDHSGFRSDFALDIVELTFAEGLRKKGSWNSTEGINLTLSKPENEPPSEALSLQNKTFIVLISLTPPYGMLKEDINSLTGNDRYEGLGIDIIHELSLMNGFNYTFHLHHDTRSGNPELDKDGARIWNGMIGEVIAERADLAIADITITREREMDVDFTMPFMNLGISVLYKKPTKLPPSLFSFLSPFTYEVWWYMIAAYLGVSILLFITGRISPSEWTNPYPCIDEPENLENQFSLNNSLWFTLGSIMQQGSEIAPIAVSTRMAASVWWFFTLIMVSSYTANLAAFLTVEIPFQAFRSVEDLSNQNPQVISYGAKTGGATANFFRDSNHSTYQRIWQFMSEHQDSVMTSNNIDGVNKVINEKYAFFMESTSIEYEVERKCELTQVGSLLDSKGYGIVMRKNSWYRNVLSTSVLSLQEKGKLTQLKTKWWKEKRGGGACPDDGNDGGSAAELGLDNVGGIFVVLISGSALACIIAIFECVWEICKKKEKVSFKQEIIEEIKFILNCKRSTKPVRKSKSDTDDMSEENSSSLHPYESYHTEKKHPLE